MDETTIEKAVPNVKPLFISSLNSIPNSVMRFNRSIDRALVIALSLTLLVSVFAPVSNTCAQNYFHTVEKRASPLAPPPQTHAAVKTVGTNLKAFGVPFKVNAKNASFIEVQLYVSRDLGKTWSFHSRKSTDQTDFAFQSDAAELDGDGEYWFSLKTLDRDRRLLPEGDPQAELKIIVDTKKPTLDFRIETDAAGRVVCRWNAKDKNLLPKSLRILYQSIDSNGVASPWQQVPIQLNGTARVGIYADQIAWWPRTSQRQLNVLVEIKDVAGNITQAKRNVMVRQTGWRHRAESTAQITDPPRDQNAIWRSRQNDEPLDQPANDQPSQFKETAKRSPQASKTQLAKKQLGQDQHPPNMVCKDGVCRIVPNASPDSPERTAPERTAQVPNLFPPQSDSQFPPNPLPIPDGSTDYAAPPVPAGMNLPAQSSLTKTGNANQSVPWPSDLKRRRPRNRETIGTTVGGGSTFGSGRPDPSLAPPLNPAQRLAKPATNIPANPSSMKRIGDQVVSESSTKGRGAGQSNQYRGQNSHRGQSLPRPDLLPSMTGAGEGQTLANSIGKNANYTAENSANRKQISGLDKNGGPWSQPPAITNGFSQAGFANSGVQDPAQQKRSIVENIRRDNFVNNGRVPMQIIGSQRFRLDYGIDAIDPSGVAKVDLWMTRDGRTWNAWGSDPDNQSPFPVAVEQDGRYGFQIVVRSKDGLTGQGPSTGDDADMWVLVDTQSPLANITSVPYGRGEEAGQLVVNYSVADDQLTLRPIMLSYGDNPKGPWIPIGEGLRNEGRYVWKPQSNVPDQIYLRIDALDKAGNIGVHVLPQVIDVSGLVPRGTIRGVVPVRSR